MSLGEQVDAMAARFGRLEKIACEMFNTIKINAKLGHINATTHAGEVVLAKMIDRWEEELDEFINKGVPIV
jgi:hypothetical protein